jgi:hypothetical protein
MLAVASARRNVVMHLSLTRELADIGMTIGIPHDQQVTNRFQGR